MAALCISNATSPHGFLIPPHRYLRDRQSEEQRAGGWLLPHGNACPREQGDGALANGTAAPKGGRRSRDSSESGTLLGVGPGLCRTSENAVKAKFAQRVAPRESGKLERPWELYGRLLLPHQLLEGHAVCPGDLRHGRHIGRSLAGLQVHESPVGYVGELRRFLLRKTPLLPKNPQPHRDRSQHHCAPLDQRGRSPVEPRSAGPILSGAIIQPVRTS